MKVRALQFDTLIPATVALAQYIAWFETPAPYHYVVDGNPRFSYFPVVLRVRTVRLEGLLNSLIYYCLCAGRTRYVNVPGNPLYLAKAMGMVPRMADKASRNDLLAFVEQKRESFYAFINVHGDQWATGSQRQYAQDIGVTGVNWDVVTRSAANRMITEKESATNPPSQSQFELIRMLRLECNIDDDRQPVSKSQAGRLIDHLLWCKQGVLNDEHYERASIMNLIIPKRDLLRLNVPTYDEVCGRFKSDPVTFGSWYRSNNTACTKTVGIH